MSASDPRFVDGDRPVQRLSRRAALKLALGGAGLAILAACAPQPPAAPAKPTEAPKPAAPAATTAPAAPAAAPKPTEAPKPAAAAPTAAAAPPAAAKPTEAAKPAAATPKSGGTLKVGQAGDIVSLDPHFNQYATSDLAWTTYDRLIQYDTSFKPTPMLAESWEVSSDNKQIKFNLRKGVQWHSGREMTSEDVKYTLNRVLDPKVGVGQYAAQAKWWVSVETPDKYTVIAKSDEPRPLMFDFWELLNISDKEILEGPDAKSKINGTGPFKLKEWVQGDHATFEKNKNYWQSGKPYLDAIELKIMADSQAMMVQLESGAIDVVRNPTKQEFARLQKDSRFTGVIYPNTVSGYAFGINVTTPPLTDKRVRQALNYAFDRKRYVESMLAGVGKPVSLPWAQSFPMYEASKENHYTFDLDKAKAMLAEANVSNLEMEFLISPAYPEGGDVGAMFQADLAKIGVKLTIVKQETAAWSDMVNNRKYPHLYYAGSNLNLTPGTIFSVSRPIGPKNNNEGFETPEYTKLVETVAAETDPAKLKALYSQLNDTLLNEAFFNFLSPNYLITLTKANVKDFTPAMHGRWLYTDVWLS